MGGGFGVAGATSEIRGRSGRDYPGKWSSLSIIDFDDAPAAAILKQ